MAVQDSLGRECPTTPVATMEHKTDAMRRFILVVLDLVSVD
jgi:hypothetical protein